MLKEVDIPILIPRYNNKFIDFSLQNLIKAPYPGSRGWSESLKRVFNGS
jgi:mannosyl-3-phosphoglycerate phosphatase